MIKVTRVLTADIVEGLAAFLHLTEIEEIFRDGISFSRKARVSR